MDWISLFNFNKLLTPQKGIKKPHSGNISSGAKGNKGQYPKSIRKRRIRNRMAKAGRRINRVAK